MKTIFVSLDTTRADRLPGSRYPRRLTPNLDRLAMQSALFTQCFASDVPTQPSHTSVFTGRFGINTGIVSHFFEPASLAHDVAWLPTIMQQAGHVTGAVDHLFAMKDWFIRGYDDYLPPPGRSRSPGEVVNAIALDWLKAHAHDDFFLFLHFWDAHIPYVPPEPFLSKYTAESACWSDPDVLAKLKSRPSYPLFERNNYQHLGEIPNLQYVADLYDAEIASLDNEIGRLIGHLEQLGILDDTLLVIFGDHGEVMTEHNSWFDHAGLYDAVTHVPLMIRFPGQIAPGRHESLVQLVDVFATVLDIAGFEAPPDIDGASLVPMLSGSRAAHREEVFLSECTWQATRAIRTAEWKLIRCWDPGIYDAPPLELYHLPSDPDEQTNLAATRPRMAHHLDARLGAWLAGQLRGRRDPFEDVLGTGLPAVARLRGIEAEEQVAVP